MLLACSLGPNQLCHNTTDFSPNAGDKALTITVTAKDNAGNESTAAADSTRNLTINQDTDRPEIKIINISSDGAVLKYGTNSQINGTVKDDDSDSSKTVKEFAAYHEPITSSNLSASAFSSLRHPVLSMKRRKRNDSIIYHSNH